MKFLIILMKELSTWMRILLRLFCVINKVWNSLALVLLKSFLDFSQSCLLALCALTSTQWNASFQSACPSPILATCNFNFCISCDAISAQGTLMCCFYLLVSLSGMIGFRNKRTKWRFPPGAFNAIARLHKFRITYVGRTGLAKLALNGNICQ